MIDPTGLRSLMERLESATFARWTQVAEAPAGEAPHGAAGGEEHAAGLPQFDFATFPSQLFWLAVIFGLLYLVLSRALLPRVGRMIEARDARIADDLGSAANANQDAQSASQALEAAMADARNHARAALEAARAKAGEIAAAQVHDADLAVAAKVAAAEADIAKARETGLAAARDAACEAASDIVARLAGVKTAPGDLAAKAKAAFAALAQNGLGGRA